MWFKLKWSSFVGHEGEIFGVVDFWVRLFPPAEPTGAVAESAAERRTVTQRSPPQIMLGWQDSVHEVKLKNIIFC